MAEPKYTVGEAVELYCPHQRDGRRVTDWLAGVVVAADYRMAAVRLATDVFAANGWPVPDRTLLAAHGSPHLRRPAAGRPTESSERTVSG